MLWNWFGLGRRESRDRLLFYYRDGRNKRRADPVYVENILIRELGHDWVATVAELSAPYPPGLMGETLDTARAERAKTRQRVVDAICAAFDVQQMKHGREVDPETGRLGAGLGEIELFGLLEGYQRFVVALLEISRPFARQQGRASPTTGNPPAPRQPESTSAAPESPMPEPVLSPTPSLSPS